MNTVIVAGASGVFGRHVTRTLGAAGYRVLGLGRGAATETMVGMLRKRQLPAFRDRGRVLPWINLADAATAVLAAIERGRPGEAYNVADESALGFGGAVRAIAAASGTPRPVPVPTWLT